MDAALASRPVLDPLFEEAHRRARRRRIALSIGVIAAVAAVAVAALWPDSHRPDAPQPAAVPAVPHKLVVKSSYMGVSCRTPNGIQCDRVGLAIWTKRPARSVRATVGGRSFALSDSEWSGPARHGLRRMFAGFLQPAGLTASGPLLAIRPDRPGVSPTVQLVITRADGTRRATTLTVPLAPGWG